MSQLLITFTLYMELLLVAMTLLLVMFVINLALYKRKLTDPLSLMLLASVIVSILDIIRVYTEGNVKCVAATYVISIVTPIADLFATMEFCRYFISHLGVKLRKKHPWISIVVYWIPLVFFSAICISTPWTHLLFEVDASGNIVETPLYDDLIIPAVTIYRLMVTVLALHRCINHRKFEKETTRTAVILLIFMLLTISTFNLQHILVKYTGSDQYSTFSLGWTIGLVLLTTYVNTSALIRKESENASVEKELRIGASIQLSALPDASPEFPESLPVSLRAFIKPALEVGGDFYDYFFLDESRLCFLIADVSDKGVAAALFMMTAKTMLKDHAMRSISTEEVFDIVNQQLCESNRDMMFATAWIGILDIKTMVLHYTNAGHTKPFLLRKGDEIRTLKEVHGMPLASMDGMTYEHSELVFREGDSLFLYTDGVTEAINPEKKLFGADRVAEVLKKTQDAPGEAVFDAIMQSISDFSKDEPQFDDITMMCVKILEL